MSQFRSLFDSCFHLLNLKFSLLGYDISFWNVLVFFFFAGVLMHLFYGMME